MEETTQLREALERMDQTNQKQLKYARLQCIFSLAAAVFFAVTLVVVLCLLPRINAVIDQADTVLSDAQQVSNQLASANIKGIFQDLEDVTSQMAEADLAGIAQDVDTLVQTTQESVEEAMNKLNTMDLESLNQAIADLSAVIQPLAALFKVR